MKIKKLIISFILIITTCFTSHAQDYFVAKGDTTFCSNLKYTTTGKGYLKSINYTDAKRKNISINGRKNVPDIEVFHIDSSFIDKTPLRANKPNSYIRYSERAVDGKLKVYIGRQGYISGSNWSTTGPTGPSGIYRFYLKMPNGTYYKINKKSNLRKYIKPYLLKCVEFKNQYKGDFSTEEQPFMDLIKLYNSICE